MAKIDSLFPCPKIRQSVVRWTFQQVPLDKLRRKVAAVGLKGIDVLSPDEYEVPAHYGLECSMAFVGIGDNEKITYGAKQSQVNFLVLLNLAATPKIR